MQGTLVSSQNVWTAQRPVSAASSVTVGARALPLPPAARSLLPRESRMPHRGGYQKTESSEFSCCLFKSKLHHEIVGTHLIGLHRAARFSRV